MHAGLVEKKLECLEGCKSIDLNLQNGVAKGRTIGNFIMVQLCMFRSDEFNGNKKSKLCKRN